MVFKIKYLDLIKEVGSISVDIFENMLHEYVVENIKKVSDNNIDISLLRWLCNVVENSIDKKHVIDEKINKKQIVLNEYVKLKPNANQQQFKDILEKMIEDLHNTKQIKKISQKNKLFHKIKSVVLSSTKK